MTDTAQVSAGDSNEARSERRRLRSLDTRRSVVWGEKIARGVITVGGLMVIVAVFGIMIFLFRVVSPLLSSGEVLGETTYRAPVSGQVLWVNGDEFQTMGISVDDGGEALVFHIPTGTEIARQDMGFDATATAVSGTIGRDQIAVGFEDGSVRFASLAVSATATRPAQLPSDLQRLSDRDRTSGGRVFTQVQTGDFRTLSAEITVGEPEQISERPIVAVDYRTGGTAERPTISFATVDADNIVRVSRSRIQRNMMTGEETVRTSTVELPALPLEGDVQVTDLLLSGSADRAIVGTSDGRLHRYDLRNIDAPILAESLRATPDGVAISALTFLGGEQSLVVGGSDGSLGIWFRIQRAGARGTDGFELVQSRSHQAMPAAVIDLTEAQRDKSFAATDMDGNVWLVHSTSDQVLFEFARSTAEGQPSPAQSMIFPRGDGILLMSETGAVEAWQFRANHAEVTLRVLFGQIWYEGYGGPEYIWQSTAGTDLAEPKYSLVPLVFGTFKAAFYAMLFAAPIALMAAIYTSEFVDRRVRATVKPMMEMMESLPTVVLGFVAALVLAPLVEEWIGAVLLGFFALPTGLMLGAFLWQMLPVQQALRFDGFPKFVLMAVTIIVTAWVAYNLGTPFEWLLFYGDFKAWTTGRIGTGTPFMFLILLPVSYLALGWTFRRTLGHHWRALIGDRDRAQAGRLDVLRWLAMLAAAMLLSFALASMLTLIGYDPRGGFIDSYQQRNALVVGFVMAFAVIPNIYTLAEDALNAVPGHLRAASLACGATPWQTAILVVLPTAMSGVFSAVMMGFGRAVGETMIVVMAAGNTPIMEWNIFSGLRTLSANIAIELPEAVKDGTNYRVLFLAALTLFIMTFVINTLAELIRQRFRKRAFQL
ncbi:MAG: ABC transporter permease subunit [Pararhodobacter sp.]|nr:ABC transporter permease subunit [Pararhodobacter sp.]